MNFLKNNNIQIQRMKVFSKGQKNNRSTPLLQTVSHTTRPTPKPKGISKVLDMKNKLMRSNHDTVRIGTSVNLKSEPSTDFYAITEREKYQNSNRSYV
jgi:hypothetical protein